MSNLTIGDAKSLIEKKTVGEQAGLDAEELETAQPHWPQKWFCKQKTALKLDC